MTDDLDTPLTDAVREKWKGPRRDPLVADALELMELLEVEHRRIQQLWRAAVHDREEARLMCSSLRSSISTGVGLAFPWELTPWEEIACCRWSRQGVGMTTGSTTLPPGDGIIRHTK
mgnify:CR=1 FL=1